MAERFEIVQALEGEFFGHRGGNWTTATDEEFASEEEAVAAIQALIAMGDGWEEGVYRVQRIGDQWPLESAYGADYD